MELEFLDGNGYDAFQEFDDLFDRFPVAAGIGLATLEDIVQRGSRALGGWPPCDPPDLYSVDVQNCTVFFVALVTRDSSGAEVLPCRVAVALVACDLTVGQPFTNAVGEARRRRAENGI